ncbi:MAG: hypothetical protein LBC17_01380, partial [Lactobacillaceae bacterium]|nr:hypothetical protein [Lactobacillaceae bacterium]
IDNSEKKNIIISLAIIALIIVGFAFYLFNYVHNPISLIIKVVTILSLLVTVFYFATIFRSNKATKVEKKKVIAYIPIFLSGVALWSVQEGGGTVLQTFMDNSNHPELNAQTQSVNPFVVVIGTSIMMIVYRKFASKLPSLFTRYGIGLLLVAASYYFLVPASIQKHGFSVWWIFGSLAIAAMGEVLISPVGLDLTNKLAPKNFKAQLMSIWNLADSVAQAINAFFAAYFISHTTNYFIIYASIVAVFAIMLFIGGKRFEKVINE